MNVICGKQCFKRKLTPLSFFFSQNDFRTQDNIFTFTTSDDNKSPLCSILKRPKLNYKPKCFNWSLEEGG